MKRLLAALLFIALAVQAASLSAFAEVGRVLSDEELARAYALTGLGDREAVYHNGMKPNAAWNATQLSDWLSDRLDNNLYNIDEILSRANYTLNQLREDNPDAWQKFVDGGMYARVEALTVQAEALREELRHYQQHLTECAGLIAQMTYALEQEDALYDSDRVRKSARIEQAMAEIESDRAYVLSNADAWEAQMEQLRHYLTWGPTGEDDEDEPFVGDPLSELFTGGDMVANTAPVSTVNASGSRLSRLAGDAGYAANPADAEIVVVSDTEIVFEMTTEQNGKKVPVEGVELKIMDLNASATSPLSFYTDRRGLVRLPTNKFVTDKYDVIHLKIRMNGVAKGYRDLAIDDLDLDLGEIYRINLVPLSASNNGAVANASDKPYLVSAQLGSKDILNTDYDMIYSTANTYELDVKVEVADAAGYPEPVLIWYENVGGFKDPQKKTMKATGHSGNVYTFRGAWRSKFSPEAKAKPTISFGEAKGAVSYTTRLKSVRSATDKPLNEGTGPNGGVFGKVLGKGFGISTDIPIGGSDSDHIIHLGLNLPFSEYLPKLNIDPAGFIVMWIGSDVLGDKISKEKVNWQSRDQKEFTRAQKYVEKEVGFANYMSQADLAFDFYREKAHKFLYSSTINIGLFATASGRWELDNSDPDVKTKLVNLRGGFGATATYAFDWTWSYAVGPLPVFVGFTFGVSVGFGLEYDLTFCWVNGSFQKWQFRFIRDLTVNINLNLAAYAGVGVKGFLDIYVKLGANLNLMVQLFLDDTAPSRVKLTYGASFTVGATLFWIDARYIWNFAHGTLYDNYDSNSANLLAHYMNEQKNAGTEVPVRSQEPDDYPALVPKAKALLTNREDVSAGIKLLNAGKHNYMFFLSMEDSGVTRVHWKNLSTGKEQSFSEALKIYQEYDGDNYYYYAGIMEENDCGFDVREADGLVVLVDCYVGSYDEDGFPRNGQSVVMAVLEPQDDGSLSARFNRTTVAESKELTQYTRKYLFVRASDSFNPQYDEYSSMNDPQITDLKAVWQDQGRRELMGIRLRGIMTEIQRSAEDGARGVTFFACTGNDRKSGLQLIADKPRFIYPNEGYERTRLFALLRRGANERYVDYSRGTDCPDFVALNTPTADNKGAPAFIELFEGGMNKTNGWYWHKTGIPLVKGDIRSMLLFDETNGVTRLLYTQAEKNADGVEQIRLHGLVLQPAVDDSSRDIMQVDVQHIDYDVTLPGAQLSLGYIGSVPYLLWWSATPKGNDIDSLIWRVWGAAMATDASAVDDAHVLAQFELPRVRLGSEYVDSVPTDVLLTASGTGYLVSRTVQPKDGSKKHLLSAYSFEEQLKAVADPQIALPQATAVKPGDFEDIDVGIMNTGNIALAGFDVEMREVDKNGKESGIVQTAHIDLIHPEKNTLTMQGNKQVLKGQAVAHRVEDCDYSPRQRDFIVKNEALRYKINLAKGVNLESMDPISPQKSTHLSTDVLMPGSLGDFRTTFKIPDNWKGEKKLRLRVNKTYIESNWLANAANAAGLQSNAAGEESVQLVYALNPNTGKMELEAPAVSNSAVNAAIASGIYPNAVEAGGSVDVVTVIHDIDVDHRVYAGVGGEDWVDITVRNAAATGEELKLSCAVYLDGANTPNYVNLPYYRAATSTRRTHTISMPLRALVGDVTGHERARVVINAVGAEECVLANNEFTVYLEGEDALRILRQPEDATVQEGEDVSFTVEAGGGAKPYSYQWQIWNPKTGEWMDLAGFTDPVLRRRDVEGKWDGARFRCVVTDATGTQVISREVTLTVREEVPTGDASNLPLYLLVALAAIGLLAGLSRKRRWSR